MAMNTFLRTLCDPTYHDSVLVPHPLYEDPGQSRKVVVQRTRDWRAQAKGERDAGFSSIIEKLTFPWFQCHICGICIGPDYETQHLYLYPVYKESVPNHKKRKEEYWNYKVLKVCDDCAIRRLNLPEWLCVVNPYCWTTTMLITEGEQPTYSDPMDHQQAIAIRLATKHCVEACEAYLFCLLIMIADPPPDAKLVKACEDYLSCLFLLFWNISPHGFSKPVENHLVKRREQSIFSDNPFRILYQNQAPGLSF